MDTILRSYGTASRILRVCAALLGVLVLLAPGLAGAQPPATGPGPELPELPEAGGGQGPPEFVESEVLVQFEPDTSPSERRGVYQRNGVARQKGLPLPGVQLLTIEGAATPPQLARQLRAEASVVHAEPNFLIEPTLTPNDTYYDRQWGLHNTGQTGGISDADIDAPQGWNAASGSGDVVVAVVDTGMAIGHEDLAGNVWTNPGETAGNNVDDDGNGYVDDVHGWDFFNNDNSVYDSASADQHGTMVAGALSAVMDNGRGVAGVSQAQIMPLKFMGSDGNDGTTGSSSGAIDALDYARDMKQNRGVNVLLSNNSWTVDGHSSFLQDAIQRAGQAGQLFVAAAGNEGVNIDSTPAYPASYPDDNIVSVAATDDDDGLANFSNFGDTDVDLGAPGVEIATTVPGGYAYASGTSIAAPYVSGVLAQMLGTTPSLGSLETKDHLLSGGDAISSLQDRTATGRRLNLGGALGVVCAKPFMDVPTSHTFCEEIRWMADEGISTGYGDGTYRPGVDVTRQAMSAFMARLAGASLSSCSTAPFDDVPVGHPFCPEIRWMADAGISTGYADGTYRPGVDVTRQAMSAFMARLAGAIVPLCLTDPFDDVPVGHPFCPEIAWMADAGISTGYADGTYRPGVDVTRQAMSAFMYRLAHR